MATAYPPGFIGPVRPEDGYTSYVKPAVQYKSFSPDYNSGQVKGTSTSNNSSGNSPSPSNNLNLSGYNVGDIVDWNGQKIRVVDPGKNDYTVEGGGNDVNSRENQIRGEINSGFDQYFSGLDQLLGKIPGQRQGQEQIVQNNYNQGVSDIQAQKQSSQQDLDTSKRKSNEQQVKSLQDIADNIRNLFKTGNVMLGTRGAGDSSAADQYSYAVAKLGSKQRGDVLSQSRSIENDIADREAKLNNIVTQETAKLKTDRDNQIIQVAQYFQDKQNELIQAKAQGQLQKGQSLASLSTQLLQNAQAQLMQADANFKNQQNALISWATSNAKDINQLKTNLANVGQYNVPGIQMNQINGQPQFDAQGNLSAPLYGGAGSTRDDQIKNPFLSSYA